MKQIIDACYASSIRLSFSFESKLSATNQIQQQFQNIHCSRLRLETCLVVSTYILPVAWFRSELMLNVREASVQRLLHRRGQLSLHWSAAKYFAWQITRWTTDECLCFNTRRFERSFWCITVTTAYIRLGKVSPPEPPVSKASPSSSEEL